MSTVSPSKERFCSIIGEIVDKSCDIIVDTEEALEYDAVELTVLLKSIGFRLNSFEFDTCTTPDANDIEIDIRCKRSGITSKLQVNAKKCTCPVRSTKAENNNSYWEIQGRGPQTPVSRFKGIVKDTSCDLLPDISRKSANIARTTLAMLLQNYQNDFSPDKERSKNIDVKSFSEYLNIKRANTEEFSAGSRTSSMPSISENETFVKKSLSSNNLSSIKSDTNLNSNVTSSNENNGCETDTKCDNNKIISDDSLTFPSLSSIKSEVSDLTGSNFEFMNQTNEKNANLIEKILRARKELDIALSLLQGNKPNTDQLSDITITSVTATPTLRKQVLSTVKTRRSYPGILPAGRRSSIGSTEGSSQFSLLAAKPQPKTQIVKRHSFKQSPDKGITQTKTTTTTTTLRRTSSGTNLKTPNNLLKGQITKNPNSKISSYNMKKT